MLDVTVQIKKELPINLVQASQRTWKSIQDGRNVSELDEALYWQAIQIAYLHGQIAELKIGGSHVA